MTGAKILVVTGSPRRQGNCAILTDQLGAGAEGLGESIEVVRLHDLMIRPCSACRACKQTDDANCVIDDDMQQIYPKIRQAEALVIVSPIYWWNLTAQTKLFIDRCDALEGPGGNALAGKRLGILLVYGGEDAVSSGAVNAIRSLQDAIAYIGIDLVGLAHGTAWEEGSVRENARLMGEAFDLGRNIANRVQSEQ